VTEKVDLFVIGAGSGGVRAARISSGYGARVMIAEEYRVGGTCVIRGCVPKKLLVYAARFRHEFEDAAGFGWTVPEHEFDWATLIRNKDKEIARLEAAYVSTLERAKVAIVRSRAVFESSYVVRLSDGTRVEAERILIATGGTPNHGPDIPGIEHVISSNEAFDLPELPRRILIQGAGYIAIEFACIFAGLGSEVTVVYRGDKILRGFDDDVRTHLTAEMEKRGVKIVCCQNVVEVKEEGGHKVSLLSGGESIESDVVMFALGRTPNVRGLGVEAAGVAVAPNGMVVVDKYSQTSVSHIYAIGDVTNRINLTPVAIREGHAFADTIYGNRPTAVDHRNVATAVFSEPEVGVVGLTEAEARQRHRQVDIYKATFRPMKATLSGRDTRMLMKLIVDCGSDRVLGCHIVGEAAAEIIQMVGVAVQMGATKADFDATMALHPSAAEELVTMRTPTARYGQEAAE
jgi:glutathione reductase (NADPH)